LTHTHLLVISDTNPASITVFMGGERGGGIRFRDSWRGRPLAGPSEFVPPHLRWVRVSLRTVAMPRSIGPHHAPLRLPLQVHAAARATATPWRFRSLRSPSVRMSTAAIRHNAPAAKNAGR